MKFPNFYMNRSYLAHVSVLLIGLFLMSGTISAQKKSLGIWPIAPTFAPLANPSANLDLLFFSFHI